MPRGFAVSGSKGTSSQSSNQGSQSNAFSDASSGQRYDPMANNIRYALFNQFTGQSQPQSLGDTRGPVDETAPTQPAKTFGTPLTPDQRQAQLQKNQERTNSYTGPQITVGGIYSPDMTNKMLNLQQSQNTAATQGYIAGIPRTLAGRGFASGASSPLAMELERRALQQNQAENAKLGTEFPFGIAKDNADHLLATQQAGQGAYQAMKSNEVARMQAANQAGSTSAQERIAKLNSDTSQRNALLQALTSLAQPLNRSRSISGQTATSFGNSSGKSSQQSSNVNPYSFEDFAI
jgi:hypothetical protein